MKKTQLESKINTCRVCNSGDLVEVFDLGKQPIANNLLETQNQAEDRFPLQVLFCRNCGTAQQGYTIDRDTLFKEYTYNSSFSPKFRAHFEKLAEVILEYEPMFVIEVGSNDGILLRLLKDKCEVLGVDPAEEIVKKANAEGLPTTCGYIEDRGMLHQHSGQADVVVGCNVFAHISKIHQAVANVARLMKDDGVFIFEVQYLGDLIKNNYFDMIYHEHYFYWSVTALKAMLSQHGLYITNVERIPTHGGSIRVFVGRGWVEASQVTHTLLEEERALGLDKPDAFADMWKRAQKTGQELCGLLSELDGKRVIGYGAPAKGNTLLNYFEINNRQIEMIVDDAETKQGKFTPGSRIPIVARPEKIEADYILILAWNYAEPIMEKLREDYNGKFIIPLPELRVI